MTKSSFNQVVALVRRIGQELKNNLKLPDTVDQQGRDVKSKADLYSDMQFQKELARISTYSTLSEESGYSEISDLNEPYWVIDPLDGTMNYTRKFPISCVSIALMENALPTAGIIYDFNHDDMYLAYNGVARLNGQLLCVSSTDTVTQSILATGFPLKRDYDAEALSRFLENIRNFKKIRMIGAAAVSLAYVARGAFDAYFEEDIMIWDVAAGCALVQAAGGKVLLQSGSKEHSVICAATNGRLDIESFTKRGNG
jgi:myo-inositol-1(or 4)-monophosphatase